MRFPLRTLLPLALAAVLPLATCVSAGEKVGKSAKSANVAADGSSDEPIDEPLLVIPKTPPARDVQEAPPRSAPAKQSATKGSSASTAALPATDDRSSSVGSRRAPAVDADVVLASVTQDAKKAKTTKGAPAPPKKTQAPAASEPELWREPAAPPLFDGPNPAEHPARVPRKSGGWHRRGSEPAGPRPRMPLARPPVIYHQASEPASLFGGPNPGGPSPSGPASHGSPGRFTTASGSAFSIRRQADETISEFVPTPESAVSEDSEDFAPLVDDGDDILASGGSFSPPMMSGRRWTVIAGGEGLLLRPHFSQATGLVKSTITQNANNTLLRQDLINFNPGYQGAFRAYLGFQDGACGDEIRFSYFNYNGADTLFGTATANTQYCDFLCNTTPNPGDSVSTHFNLGANLWDLDCVRPFFATSQCQNPCGPTCHPWDLRWFAGFRMAYINHNITSFVTDASSPNGIFSQASAGNKFTGFGPRLGLQGRKFFGRDWRWSVYGKGAGSLLVGNVYQDVISSTTSSGLPTATELVSRNSRIIPVAELELGGTWRVLPRLAVSGGWMLMSFWDLGLQETGSVGASPGLDTSNILSFDGFFVRGELAF